MVGRGYCSLHWQRVKAWGHPGVDIPIRRHGPLEYRLADKFTKGDGCWEWTGSRDGSGYGRFMLGRKPRQAHRVVYEVEVGPIPPEMELHHKCVNPSCVRPDHMQVVTIAEHKQLSRKDECKYGHPYTPENVYIRPDTGTRMCRTCQRRRDRVRAGYVNVTPKAAVDAADDRA